MQSRADCLVFTSLRFSRALPPPRAQSGSLSELRDRRIVHPTACTVQCETSRVQHNLQNMRVLALFTRTSGSYAIRSPPKHNTHTHSPVQPRVEQHIRAHSEALSRQFRTRFLCISLWFHALGCLQRHDMHTAQLILLFALLSSALHVSGVRSNPLRNDLIARHVRAHSQ